MSRWTRWFIACPHASHTERNLILARTYLLLLIIALVAWFVGGIFLWVWLHPESFSFAQGFLWWFVLEVLFNEVLPFLVIVVGGAVVALLSFGLPFEVIAAYKEYKYSKRLWRNKQLRQRL